LFGRQKDEERHLFRVLLSLASLARFSVACSFFFTWSVALLCESGNLRRPEKGRKGKVFFFGGDAVIVVVVVFVVMV
jgi:hypothetical protein